jgi:hypothetical protein
MYIAKNKLIFMDHWRQGSSLSIVTGLWARQPRVRFPAMARDFSLLHSGQTGSVAHPASYAMSTGNYFPGSKATKELS